MGLLTPILECVPDVEPFKSLYNAPRKPVPINTLPASLHPHDEQQVFLRQAQWLSYRFIPHEAARSSSPPLLVVIDPENLVTATYSSGGPANFESRPFYVMPGPYPTDWPKTLSVTSNTSVTHLSHDEICNLFTTLSREHGTVQGRDIFAAAPTNVTPERTANHPTWETENQLTTQTEPAEKTHVIPASPKARTDPIAETTAHHSQGQASQHANNVNQPGQITSHASRNKPSTAPQASSRPEKLNTQTVPRLISQTSETAHINHPASGQVTEPKGIFGTYKPRVLTEPAKPAHASIASRQPEATTTVPKLPINAPTAKVFIGTASKFLPDVEESHGTTPGAHQSKIDQKQYGESQPHRTPHLEEVPRAPHVDTPTSAHINVPSSQGPKTIHARVTPGIQTVTPSAPPPAGQIRAFNTRFPEPTAGRSTTNRMWN
ncbi:JM131 [macacine gammaherpesvirus 11]|uniref:JM131 n=2 Tax=macacine gammaherpesvirus 11 TaxID=2560570 RepID=G9JMD9_9GAMA|nr:JM131 [Macaca fuscata rhadinovirus]AAT00108.1 JM131 [Macaca fuscata rhadinovirus]AEW87656.1 JM131 [Macaca fuscata rhadinovirus]AEW87826.1 JM131 [Macaca fuscata rhadinovirus]